MKKLTKLSNNKKLGNKNKHNKNNLKKTKKNKQQHGGKRCEKFEITTLNNVDPSGFSVAKYVNANIDWGIMPGPPPTDCTIM